MSGLAPFVSKNPEPLTDPFIGAAATIDSSHYEIHEGDHYTYSRVDTLASGASLELLLTPSGKAQHLIRVVRASGQTSVYLFEGTGKTGGTAQTAYNNLRSSLNVPSLVIGLTPAAGADGTQIDVDAFGSSLGPSTASSIRNDEEWILNPSGVYLLRVTSATNSNVVNTKLYFYEEG